MSKYAIYKDIRYTTSGETKLAKIPFIILDEFNIIDENTISCLNKINYISKYKYLKSKGKEQDSFRIFSVKDEDINLINIELFFENKDKVEEGTIDYLVDKYASETGYLDFDDLYYHEEVLSKVKKRKTR